MKNCPEIDDLTLVRQIQHGDEAAIEEFYCRFAPGLHSFIHCRVREPDDIEDILAETMTGAVTAIMRFKGQSRVFTWLCQIAKFKIADYYRRNTDRNMLPLDETLAATCCTETDSETNLLIWEALLKLSLEYRQVLEDKYFTGFSTREIAVRLGRSEKAVESILVRARRAFAEEYKRLDPETEVLRDE